MPRGILLIVLAACTHPALLGPPTTPSAIEPAKGASNAPTVPTSTSDPAPSQVYVTVRAVHSETEIRTRVTGLKSQEISIPGSTWMCTYQNVGDSKPAPNREHSVKYSMRLHALTCRTGTYGASVSTMCPVSEADLRDELNHRDTLRIAELLVLLNDSADGEQRNFISINGEP